MIKKEFYCSECGAEIIFMYETPSKSFHIENGTLIRDDNNLMDNPELTPYCSNDKEHTIEPEIDSMEFWRWTNEVEMYFIENNLYCQGEI